MSSSFMLGFEGRWRRPATDYKNAVRNYTVILDTNVLLDLYRFTPDARKELLHVLDRLKDRLWVPHQVIEEYYANRVGAVKAHLALYSSVPKSLDGHKQRVMQELNNFARTCSMSEVDRSRLVNPIEQAFDEVREVVVQRGESFDLDLERVISDDPVLAKLARILDGKTGLPFTPEEIEPLKKEFDRRAENQIPPGYKDKEAGKRDNAHGDFFVWEQVLREAQVRNSPVLLVTNDAKEDWINRESGLIVGARPELMAEMKARCGVDLLITQLRPFLRTAQEELGASISESTFAQADNLPEGQDGGKAYFPIAAIGFHAITELLERNLQDAFEFYDDLLRRGADNESLLEAKMHFRRSGELLRQWNKNDQGREESNRLFVDVEIPQNDWSEILRLQDQDASTFYEGERSRKSKTVYSYPARELELERRRVGHLKEALNSLAVTVRSLRALKEGSTDVHEVSEIESQLAEAMREKGRLEEGLASAHAHLTYMQERVTDMRPNGHGSAHFERD